MIKNWSLKFGLILVLSIGSCSQNSPPEKYGSNQERAVVWKKKREYYGLASSNYIYKKWLIQGTCNSEDGKFKVQALTLDSGKVAWEQDNFPYKFKPYGVEYTCIKDNWMVLSRRSQLYTLDLNTGNILWNAEVPSGKSNVCIIDNNIYKTTEDRESSSLFKFDLMTGHRELVFEAHLNDLGDLLVTPKLRMPVKWIDDHGNELLILSSRGYGHINFKNRMDVYAWNLTSDSMEWLIKDLDERGSSSRPVIENNRVYFYGMYTTHCINASDGEIIWQTSNNPEDVHGDFNTANILISKDIVILKPESYWMYGADKFSGKILWTNENVAPSPRILRLHKDTVWFSSGGILAINAMSGEKLIDWKLKGNGYWSNPVVHHPMLGYIYTTDGDYIYCLNPKYMK